MYWYKDTIRGELNANFFEEKKLNATTMEVRTLVRSRIDWLMTTFFMERSFSLQQEELIQGCILPNVTFNLLIWSLQQRKKGEPQTGHLR